MAPTTTPPEHHSIVILDPHGNAEALEAAQKWAQPLEASLSGAVTTRVIADGQKVVAVGDTTTSRAALDAIVNHDQPVPAGVSIELAYVNPDTHAISAELGATLTDESESKVIWTTNSAFNQFSTAVENGSGDTADVDAPATDSGQAAAVPAAGEETEDTAAEGSTLSRVDDEPTADNSEEQAGAHAAAEPDDADEYDEAVIGYDDADTDADASAMGSHDVLPDDSADYTSDNPIRRQAREVIDALIPDTIIGGLDDDDFVVDMPVEADELTDGYQELLSAQAASINQSVESNRVVTEHNVSQLTPYALSVFKQLLVDTITDANDPVFTRHFSARWQQAALLRYMNDEIDALLEKEADDKAAWLNRQMARLTREYDETHPSEEDSLRQALFDRYGDELAGYDVAVNDTEVEVLDRLIRWLREDSDTNVVERNAVASVLSLSRMVTVGRHALEDSAQRLAESEEQERHRMDVLTRKTLAADAALKTPATHDDDAEDTADTPSGDTSDDSASGLYQPRHALAGEETAGSGSTKITSSDDAGDTDTRTFDVVTVDNATTADNTDDDGTDFDDFFDDEEEGEVIDDAEDDSALTATAATRMDNDAIAFTDDDVVDTSHPVNDEAGGYDELADLDDLDGEGDDGGEQRDDDRAKAKRKGILYTSLTGLALVAIVAGGWYFISGAGNDDEPAPQDQAAETAGVAPGVNTTDDGEPTDASGRYRVGDSLSVVLNGRVTSMRISEFLPNGGALGYTTSGEEVTATQVQLDRHAERHPDQFTDRAVPDTNAGDYGVVGADEAADANPDNADGQEADNAQPAPAQ